MLSIFNRLVLYLFQLFPNIGCVDVVTFHIHVVKELLNILWELCAAVIFAGLK